MRRVDWRFLLPSPNMGRTAYLGPPDDTLLTALAQSCRSLTVVSPSEESQLDIRGDATYELVVVRRPTMAAVEKAKLLVRPGGYLYWEVDRTLKIRSASRDWREACRLRGARGYREMLERMGFGDIQVSWHRPNFESCLAIVPLGDGVALRYCFTRRFARFTVRIQAALGRSLMAAGLLTRVLPCISIVARNDSPERDS